MVKMNAWSAWISSSNPVSTMTIASEPAAYTMPKEALKNYHVAK